MRSTFWAYVKVAVWDDETINYMLHLRSLQWLIGMLCAIISSMLATASASHVVYITSFVKIQHRMINQAQVVV